MTTMGRPRKEIDWKEFEQLCFMQCSITEMCAWLHISHQSIERKCQEHYGETFGQVFAKKRVGGLISLRRNLFKQAEHSAAVAIFLAKNLLGMADKQEITGKQEITMKYSPQELTDEQLAVIAATNIIHNARNGSDRTTKAEASSP